MKKVLFVLNKYNDNSAQNALCIKGIANYLMDDFNVEYVSLDNVPKKTNGVYSFSVRSNSFLSRVLFFFTFPLRKRIESSFIRELQKIDLDSFDAVVSVMNPLEAVTSVAKIKHKYHFKFLIYEIDPQSNKYKKPLNPLKKLWNLRSKHIERFCYSKAECIFHMKTHERHFSAAFYKPFQDKTIFVDIPFIEKSLYCPLKEPKNECKTKRFLYLGAFYKTIREPDIPLDIMDAVLDRNNGFFDVFTRGKYVEELSKKFKNSNIIVRDVIPNEEALQKIKESDFLVSIGNKNSDFLPSKTIQYISTGKPIIHFSFGKDDVSVEYLKKYNNCIIIDCNVDKGESVRELETFLSTEHSSPSFKFIYETFFKNTFEFSASMIKETINDCFK